MCILQKFLCVWHVAFTTICPEILIWSDMENLVALSLVISVHELAHIKIHYMPISLVKNLPRSGWIATYLT